MKLYSKTDSYSLYHGSMLDMLNVIEPDSIDSIVTDPPYELNFMNKGWDNSGIAFQKETWEKCYTALKPGGYLLAFGGSRTFHRIAVAIEDAGFEIRDTIMWLYGSGFPKSMNIGLAIDKKNGVESKIIGYTSQQDIRSGNYTGVCTNNNEYSRVDCPIKKAQNEWDGWGTQLKPAYEPVIVARKPCEGSCVDNVMKYGVGGINIDECRVETEDNWQRKEQETNAAVGYQRKNKSMYCQKTEGEMHENGRFPSNVILTYDETDFQEVCGGMPETKSPVNGVRTADGFNSGVYGKGMGIKAGMNNGEFGDEGSASRYFYCAKASAKDRDEGLEEMEDKPIAFCNQAQAELRRGNEFNKGGLNKILMRKNIHPTVKPTDLMQYLVRLVTPKGGTVLDPFNGSGSTGKAVMFENRERNAGYKYIGIELTEEYLPISKGRIEFAINYVEQAKAEPQITGQIDLFDLLGNNA